LVGWGTGAGGELVGGMRVEGEGEMFSTDLMVRSIRSFDFVCGASVFGGVFLSGDALSK